MTANVKLYQEQFQGWMVFAQQKIPNGETTARGNYAARDNHSESSSYQSWKLPFNSGAMRLSKQVISSAQVRGDGLPIRGRHGQQAMTASLKSELQLSNFEIMLSALMRSNWTVGITLDQTVIAETITTAFDSVSNTSTITLSTGGDWIAAGLRVFDRIKLGTTGFNVADQGTIRRVVALTPTVLTVTGELVVVTTQANWDLTVWKKKLIPPTAGNLVQKYFTVEEYEANQDTSMVAYDVRIGKIDLSLRPNEMVMFDMSFVGTGDIDTFTATDAPYFTTTSSSLQTPLSCIDARITLNEQFQVDLTGFSLSIDLGLTDAKVIGAKYSPDVFSGVMKVSASITALRKDLLPFIDFLNEQTYTLTLQFVEPDTGEYISIVVPYCSLGSCDASELRREGGPRNHTINIPAELIGIDPRGAAYDPVPIKFQTSI